MNGGETAVINKALVNIKGNQLFNNKSTNSDFEISMMITRRRLLDLYEELNLGKIYLSINLWKIFFLLILYSIFFQTLK